MAYRYVIFANGRQVDTGAREYASKDLAQAAGDRMIEKLREAGMIRLNGPVVWDPGCPSIVAARQMEKEGGR